MGLDERGEKGDSIERPREGLRFAISPRRWLFFESDRERGAKGRLIGFRQLRPKSGIPSSSALFIRVTQMREIMRVIQNDRNDAKDGVGRFFHFPCNR